MSRVLGAKFNGQVSTSGKKHVRIRTSEAGVVLDPVVYIDVGQIEDTRFVVSTKYTSDHVRDVPTKGWSKVVVFAYELVQVLERNIASVSGQDAYKMSPGVVSSESWYGVHQGEKALEWCLP